MSGAATAARRPGPLILASASPRRAQLLREHGYDFIICPASHAEPELDHRGRAPSVQAEALSYLKPPALYVTAHCTGKQRKGRNVNGLGASQGDVV